MSGRVVPIVPGGHNKKLTFQNRKDYVDKALHFRLHELDSQVGRLYSSALCTEWLRYTHKACSLHHTMSNNKSWKELNCCIQVVVL